MTINQVYIFLVFILDGIIIGLLFDFFRILRKSFKTCNGMTYLEDILFWFFTGIIIMYTLYTICNGEIRIYMFIGILLGVLIYILTISKFIIKTSIKFIEISKKTIKFIFKPIILIRNFFHNKIERFFKFINKTSKRILNNNVLQKNRKK